MIHNIMINFKTAAASFMGLVAICLLASCSGNPSAFTTTPKSFDDSISTGGLKLKQSYKADFPTGGNPILVKNVREWINEELGGSYEGKLDDAEAMFKFYAEAETQRDIELGGGSDADDSTDMNQTDSANLALSFECYRSCDFKKVFESDKIVSYKFINDSYSGGAHGSEQEMCMSFRKEDGRRLDMSMFTVDANDEFLHGAIEQAIASQYFDVPDISTDEGKASLADNLLDEADQDYFPLPETNPLFMQDSVMFIYQPYEIAAFAAGLPTCTIAYKDLNEKGCLSATAKQLLIPGYKPEAAKTEKDGDDAAK
jgi:hypothetical protein